MFQSVNKYISSRRTAKYTLLMYLLVIFVLSSLNIKTSSQGFLYKDKVIHLIEYFILGLMFIRYFIHSRNIKLKKSIVYAILFGTFYAISDEIHQGFVGYFSTGIFGGVRDPDVFDVMADVVGIFLSACVYLIFSIKYKKLKINGKLYEGF